MSNDDTSWQERLDALWATIDRLEPDMFVAEVERLASELPPHSAIALFERACAQDSTGHPDRAVPL